MTASVTASHGLRRIIVLFAGGIVALIALGIAATLLLVHRSSETVDAMNEFVTAVAEESTEVTNAYLDIAESAGRVTERSLAGSDGTLDDPVLVATLQNVVAANDNVNGAFVGFPSGDFLYATKSLAANPDGLRVKRIENASAGGREVTERQTASDSSTSAERVLPDDTYDPRGRPWYQDAGSQGRGWTDPYVFASSKLPGITHYIAVHDDAGQLKGIVGIDVGLTQLTNFLADRQPSAGGSAMIVANDGSIVASGADTTDQPMPVTQLAALSASGRGVPVTTTWAAGELAHVAAVARIGGDLQWTLVITAPQQDFVGATGAAIDRFRTFLPLLGAIVVFGVSAVATTSLQRISRLEIDATTDPLTGVLNRAEVRNQLAGLLDREPDQRVAALTLDLNGFTAVNDTWGHDVGDAILREFAERLVAAIGSRGFAGRFGGVEFLAVLRIADTENVQRVIDDLLALLVEEPIATGRANFELLIRCGFCVRDPGELIDQKTMLRNADLALMTAKANVNTTVRFDSEMTMPSVRDADRRSELLDAVAAGEFEYYFQREVNIVDGTTIGAEALLRWRTADGTVIAADRFIDDLERLGVIGLLTPLMLEQSKALVASAAQEQFTVRLNLCADQLRHAETLEAIAAASAGSGARWCIEITERTIVESNADTLYALGEMVENGVELALDDFGTGYSSFAELSSLPITTIKLDRSFVTDLDVANARLSLASVICDMANRLSLSIVAEGIETADQVEALVLLGCTQGQGYWFGKPAPIDQFLEALSIG